MKYLVTGACGGMGRALCGALTEAGHEVWGLDKAVPETPFPCRLIRADLRSEEELARACEQIRREAGSLDGIIHMAGIYDLNSLVEMSGEDLMRDFDVNLFGAARLNRLALPLLSSGARIVMVSSELAPLYPLPFTGIYAITKAAVEKYACALRMELQLPGYPVILIRPGAVKTGMLPESVAKLDRFCAGTRLYRTNAARFREIVNRVEARSIPPEKLCRVVLKALDARRPRLCYTINRNPLLLLLNVLPKRLQLRIIRGILKP